MGDTENPTKEVTLGELKKLAFLITRGKEPNTFMCQVVAEIEGVSEGFSADLLIARMALEDEDSFNQFFSVLKRTVADILMGNLSLSQ